MNPENLNFFIALATLAVGALVACAEALHRPKIKAIAPLAFGPSAKAEPWTQFAPIMRILAMAALTWGLLTLMTVEAKIHKAEDLEIDKQRHLLLVLDVSPSMRLKDAGPSGKQSRMQRARDLMESFFRRVPIAEYRSSVVAVYNGAKPVVVESEDLAIIRNILNDLPMHYAFKSGKTNLFAGLEQAAKIAQSWRPRSATLLMITDGDTIPATGMPTMPASIADCLVVGIGDPVNGTFIAGRQSRQDKSTLRQLAVRLNGHYHDGNSKHLSSKVLAGLGRDLQKTTLEQLTRREYALLALGFGATILLVLPILLHWFGSTWQAGVPRQTGKGNSMRNNHEKSSKISQQKPTKQGSLA